MLKNQRGTPLFFTTLSDFCDVSHGCRILPYRDGILLTLETRILSVISEKLTNVTKSESLVENKGIPLSFSDARVFEFL